MLTLPVLAFASAPAAAAGGTTIQVPGDCPAATSGQSLVDAMQAAQDGNSSGECSRLGTSLTGPYTLILNPFYNPYWITQVNNYVDGPNGLPDVTGTVTLESSSTSLADIGRATTAPAFRLFHVSAPAVQTGSGSVAPGVPDVAQQGSLTLKYIGLSNGLAQGGAGGQGYPASGGGGMGAGGDIFSHGGSVTIENSVIDNGTAQGGAGGSAQFRSGVSGAAGGGGMGGNGGTDLWSQGGGGGGTQGNGGDASEFQSGAGGSPSGGSPNSAGGYNGGGGGGGAEGGFGGGGGGGRLDTASELVSGIWGGFGGFGGGGGGGLTGAPGGFGGGAGGSILARVVRAGIGGGDAGRYSGGGGAGMGGGVYALGGALTLISDTFAYDSAQGGAAGGSFAAAGAANGGAVFVDATNNGPTTYSASGLTFNDDTAATSGPNAIVYGSIGISVTTTTLPAAAVGSPYLQTLSAQDGTAPYTWTVTQGTLPVGLSLSSAGTISGTPTDVGISSFTVQATDSSSPSFQASQTLNIIVEPANSPLSILTAGLGTGSVGNAYLLQNLVASGGVPPYTWSVASGSLPAGLALNSVTGAVYGTPTAEGTSYFAIQAADSAGNTTLKGFSIAVLPSGPFGFTSGATLPGGVVGTPYSYTLSTVAGGAPVTFGILAGDGSLPPGLTLDSGTGVISGTPTTAGSSSFTVSLVSASLGLSNVGSFTIDIAATEPETVTLGSATGTVPVDGSTTVSGSVYTAAGGVPGAEVDLSLSGASGASISPTVATTDASGDYGAQLTAPPGTGTVTVTATVYGTTYSTQSVVLVTPVGVTTSAPSNVVTSNGGNCATAQTGQIYESGCGSGVLAVTQYSGNPVTAPPSGSVQYYFDASVGHGSGYSQAGILACGAQSGEVMQWWNPTAIAWQDVSPAASTSGSCLIFVATSASTPSVGDLFGTAFALVSPAAPGGAGTGSTSGSGSSGVAPAVVPLISGISPSSGPAVGGTTVTITGSGFDGATAVAFGPVPATSFTVGADSQITAISPAGSGTVDVTVTTPGGTASTRFTDQFTYTNSAQRPTCTKSYADVPASFWAAGAIQTLTCRGVVNGFPDGTFQPDTPVTRAQFVKMLDLTLGLKLGGGLTPFGDVAPSAWYAPYVAAAVQAGLVRGVSQTSFAPNDAVTREQLAVLVARGLHLTGTVQLHFTDRSQIAPWALPAIEEAVAGGYLNGFPNGTFQPLGAATRGQAAKVLAEFPAQQAS